MGQIGRSFGRADRVNLICASGKSGLSGFGLTPATVLATLQGGIPIEWIRPGDMVLTRDDGYVPVAWVGPIGVAATVSLGRTDCSSGVVVGIRQPVLFQSPPHASQHGCPELLIAAEHHPATDGAQADAQRRELHSLALKKAGLILADGIWIETLVHRIPCVCGAFHPGPGNASPRPVWDRSDINGLTVAGAA